jgi:dipeptidyl-peptidase-4
LAIVQIDDTEIEDYTFHNYGTPGDMNDQYPHRVDIRYPKTGGKLPQVKVLIKDLRNLNSEWIQFTAPIDKVSNEHIIGPVRWYGDDQVVLTWFNRRQNLSFTQLCSADDNKSCEELFSISEPKGWIDWWMVPVCSLEGNKCFYFKHHNGWFGIHEVDVLEGDITPVMDRPVTAIEIFGFDHVTGDLYYSSTVEEHPEFKQVYKNDVCLTCDVTGPDGDKCTYSNAVFSNDFSYYAMICNGPSLPYSKLFKTEGVTELYSWEENADTREKLEAYEKINIIYDRIEVADGFKAIVKLYLPNEIDINNSIEKYPMILYIYGAPNHVRVLDTFSIGYQNYLVTKQKVIYCLVDGRGSGYKGTDMLFTVNNRMGTIEIEDNIDITKKLVNKYKFIDADRIGIWGWSYGGYATALTITEDTEKVFKSGISVAPAISFYYYDPIYSERYMGKPTKEDNLEGYERGDVSRRADKFHNHDFFLIHGTADDNVHFQHAMLFSKELQKENVYFEQLTYPNEDHGLGGVTKHLYKTMDAFWTRTLSIE